MRIDAIVDSKNPTEIALVRVRRQHVRLAALFDEIEAAAQLVLSDPDRIGVLKGSIAALRGQLLAHLEYEEAHLFAALRAMGPWGAERADAMSEEHSGQRSDIDALVHDAAALKSCDTIAHEALSFVHRMRKDTADEDALVASLRAQLGISAN